MTLVDTLVVVGVLGILALLLWSRMMTQSMLDTLREIKTFLQEMGVERDE